MDHSLKSERNIYIVLSQTGTILSRLLKIVTKKKYNHASISFEDDLDILYSFGRLKPYNPFRGGFVQESKRFGTFKRFKDTIIIVIAMPIETEKYNELKEHIEELYKDKDLYTYNYLGLFLALFNRYHQKAYHYYCSEFVGEMIDRINDKKMFNRIIHPVDFLNIPNTKIIYTGKLINYID